MGFLLFVGTITGVVGIGNLVTGYITPGIVLTAIGLGAYYWAYTMYKSQQQVGIDFQANLLATEMQLGHRGTEGGKVMPSPNAELINTLERIASIKNQLSGVSAVETIAIRGCFNVLGLYVQMPEGVVPRSISGLSSDRSGFLLQAGVQQVSYLDAWRLEDEIEWHIVKYEAGRWEDLVLPMLELAEFFPGYFSSPGSIGEKVNTITAVGQHYQETGTLQLPADG